MWGGCKSSPIYWRYNMKHEKLKSNIYSCILQVYRILYDQNKNEVLAKRYTLKVVDEALSDLGLDSDIYIIYNKMHAEYKSCTDESKKFSLRSKLEKLKAAIDILEE
jgi:hypothetical protein